MTSIRSFIAYISAIIGGGAESMRMEGSCFAALVCLGCYCPLAFLGPLIRHWYLLGFPPECYVLHPFGVAAPPDHDSVL